MLRRVAHVKSDVSEEPGASLIRVKRIGELGTTQTATSNRRTLRRNRILPSGNYVCSIYSFVIYLTRQHIKQMEYIFQRINLQLSR
jgi:hypothetical protein